MVLLVWMCALAAADGTVPALEADPPTDEPVAAEISDTEAVQAPELLPFDVFEFHLAMSSCDCSNCGCGTCYYNCSKACEEAFFTRYQRPPPPHPAAASPGDTP